LANHKHIVKRAGHSEPYEQRKVYASVYSALLAVHEPTGTAELLSDKVTQEVDTWMEGKTEVTSADILRKASERLNILHPDAAWIYLYQRSVC